MRMNNFRSIAKAVVRTASILLFGAVATFGQQAVNLTAGPTTAALPDGSAIPMWGYSCGAIVTASSATCAALNPNAAGGWSPVVITVPTGQSLTISLTNNLSFAPPGGTTANTVPTSIMIVGQVGGGLGSTATAAPSPSHSGLPSDTVTWSTVGTSGPGFTPRRRGRACNRSQPKLLLEQQRR